MSEPPVVYTGDGYDMQPPDHHVYAFVSADNKRVKVGLVNEEKSLRPRLVAVTRARQEPGLRQEAVICLRGVDEHEAEDLEAAIRLYLVRVHGFTYADRVDWLHVPDDQTIKWQRLLERALAAALEWKPDAGR